MNALTTLGVPIDSVGRSGGTEHAPAALRSLGIVEALGGSDADDLDVRIRGDDRDPATGLIASADVLQTTAVIREAVVSLLADGAKPFLIGGCCTELVGALAAARDVLGRVGLAYLDGHLDLYDGVTSPTGEAADMPVSVALGFGPQAWVDVAGGVSARGEDVAILGYRDLEESQTFGMRHPDTVGGLVYRSNDDVRVDGPDATGTRVASQLAAGAGAFWVHLDVDVLDEAVFPATDYLMPGGLTWDELTELLGPIVAHPALIGASLGCYNPDKDPDLTCGARLVRLWADVLAPR